MMVAAGPFGLRSFNTEDLYVIEQTDEERAYAVAERSIPESGALTLGFTVVRDGDRPVGCVCASRADDADGDTYWYMWSLVSPELKRYPRWLYHIGVLSVFEIAKQVDAASLYVLVEAGNTKAEKFAYVCGFSPTDRQWWPGDASPVYTVYRYRVLH